MLVDGRWTSCPYERTASAQHVAASPKVDDREVEMQIGVDSQRAVENKRVFVIDPDEVSSMALQFMLADECETHVLAGVEAARAKSSEWPPHLVLLGQGIVAAEGAAAVAAVKACGTHVKILIVCNAVDEPGVAEALANGADGTLVRPLRLEIVRRRVDSHRAGARPSVFPWYVPDRPPLSHRRGAQ